VCILTLLGVTASAGTPAQTTELVSLADDDTRPSTGDSYGPSVSGDGRYVAFFSSASLGEEDPAAHSGWGIYVRDRVAGTTELVPYTVENDWDYAPCCASISANGRFVALAVNHTNPLLPQQEVLVIDLETSTTHNVAKPIEGSVANGSTGSPSLSADGKFVVFSGGASDLVENDNNGDTDIFVHNLETGETELISKSSSGVRSNSFAQYPSISGNGRFVAWASDANNLVNAPVDTAVTYIHDRVTDKTRLVSRSSSGRVANNWTYETQLSYGGRFVVFVSSAKNLVPNDDNKAPDVFVRDRKLGTTELVSVSLTGGAGNGHSGWNSEQIDYGDDTDISFRGRYVAFYSEASDLIAKDTNEVADIFVRDRLTDTTRRVSRYPNGDQTTRASLETSMSADGRYVAFHTNEGLVPPDQTNLEADVYLRGPLR
jgi:Tol biopolymer transport system component